MIPVWVFIVALVVFIGILFNEYRTIRALREDLETVKFYLDQYVNKYGPTVPVTLTIKEVEEDKKG